MKASTLEVQTDAGKTLNVTVSEHAADKATAKVTVALLTLTKASTLVDQTDAAWTLNATVLEHAANSAGAKVTVVTLFFLSQTNTTTSQSKQPTQLLRVRRTPVYNIP